MAETSILDSLPAIVWTANKDGQFEYSNNRMVDPTEPQYSDMASLAPQIHPDDRANVFNSWSNSISTGTRLEVMYRFKRSSGSYFWLLCRANPVRKNGDIVRWVGICFDIQVVKEPYTTHDEVETLQCGVAQRTSSRCGGEFDLSAGISKLYSSYMEYSVLKRSCIKPCAYDLHGTIQLNENSAVVISARNTSSVNNKMLIEDGLPRSDQSDDAINDDFKSIFLSNMSHELRTPLNGILALTEDLLGDRSKLDSFIAESLAVIHDLGSILRTMITDILDFSKLEAHKVVLDQECFNLGRVVSNCEYLMRPIAEQKSLRLTIRAPDLPLTLVGDANRVQQVILNLTNNAIKFTDSGDVTIKVDGHTNADIYTLRIEVTDTGVGMDDVTVQHLFDPFTLGDNSRRRKNGGTGLGLSICKRLVDLMKGSIDVRSSPGIGTSFVVTMSLKQPREPAIEESSSRVCKDLRILIAEDNSINQQVLKRILNRIGFNKIDVVDNGHKAVEAADLHGYDLILMDVQMPVLDGIEATKAIRKKYASLPIIAVSASATSHDIQACLDSGMNSHVEKPISLSKVLNAIKVYY